jgi:transaldolase
MNRLRQLEQLGQSLWLDYIHRKLIVSGELQHMIDEDGVSGMTSNPTIFQKAIAEGTDYDDSIRTILADTPTIGAEALFEKLEVEDIQSAADVFKPIYEKTKGGDGYVSIEVSPAAAFDAETTIADVRRLRQEVNRPNVLVKVPGTPEGIQAIEPLVAEGFNINVTLLFTVSQYEHMVESYLRGLRKAAHPEKIVSVASFFVSRVDTAVDHALTEVGTPEALAMRGKAGIANAQVAYHRYRQVFFGPAFEDLRARGARPQRLLWASTGTKNKDYSDVLYLDQLLAPETINSAPPATIEAFRDHGNPRIALTDDVKAAGDVIGELIRCRINLSAVGRELLEQGVESFAKSYRDLLAGLEKKREALASRSAA